MQVINLETVIKNIKHFVELLLLEIKNSAILNL